MNSLALFLVARRHWLALLAVVLLALSTLGLPRLAFKNDYRMFFSKDNPELIAFENLQAKFAASDNVLIVLSARTGDLFTTPRLAALETLTNRAWSLPAARRVDSPTNFQHSEAVGDDLAVEALVRHAGQLNDEGIVRTRHRMLNEPMLLHRLISPEGRTAGVVVSLALNEARRDEQVLEIAAAARTLANEIMVANPDLEVRLTGSAMLDTAFHEAAEADVRLLIPIMFTLALALSWWLLRSLAIALIIGSMIGLSIMAGLGLAGLLGISLSPSAMAAPNIIMTLAVADSIHLLVGWQNRLLAGDSAKLAMRQVMSTHLPFVAFTTLATVVSFLTMNFSEAPPFRDLGNITALGVMVAFALSFMLLPALAIALPARLAGRPRAFLPRGLDRLLAWIKRAPRRIAVVGVIGAILASQLLWLNSLDDEYVKYFDTELSFRQDTDWIEERLTGIYELEYELPANTQGGIFDPGYLAEVDAFAEWLRQQPEVTHVFSLTDILRKLNRNFHADDPAYFRIPETREQAAQFFLAYELALPNGMDVNDRVDISRSSLRLTAALRNVSSNQIRDLEARAQAWLHANAPQNLHVAGTGTSLLFANIGARNIIDMIEGEVLALMMVVLLLGAALRSIRLGLLAMVPTLLPAAVTFGIWGVAVGQVGLASSVVAAMTLGILADDTVHFLGHYRRARVALMNITAAVEHAFSEAGQALWITSLVLIAGFSVLAFSHFRINADLGLLTVVILVLGLLADFVLLPALLLTGEKK